MMFDCAIIGGGPAGLSAGLVLGRARRKVILFDDNKARNAVTQHSHGFLTRDGVSPAELRAIAQQEIACYPSVSMYETRIESVKKQGEIFTLVAGSGEVFEARTILLATGIQETLPAVEGIYDYYGKSLFNCPYCDGWELRDKPLVILVEQAGAFHLAKVTYNWSQDLVVCTNGHRVLDEEEKRFLERYHIDVIEEKIVTLEGEDGQLERIVFANHRAIERAGGIVGVQWRQATPIGQELGCETNAMGGIATDELGRTSVTGVYAAGDTVTAMMFAQVVAAAANGSRAAAGVNAYLMDSFFGE